MNLGLKLHVLWVEEINLDLKDSFKVVFFFSS